MFGVCVVAGDPPLAADIREAVELSRTLAWRSLAFVSLGCDYACAADVGLSSLARGVLVALAVSDAAAACAGGGGVRVLLPDPHDAALPTVDAIARVLGGPAAAGCTGAALVLGRGVAEWLSDRKSVV